MTASCYLPRARARSAASVPASIPASRRAAARGFISIEVAIITPLLLFLLLGFGELYMYMRAISLVEHTAFVLADSIGQRTQLYNTTATSDPNDLGAIWNAATLLASPDTLKSKGGVILTSICDKSTSCSPPAVGSPVMTNGTPQVWWTASAPWTMSGMATRLSASTLLPSSWPFRAGDSAIVVEVFYNYTPFLMTKAFWSSAPGLTTIYKRVTVYPRTGKPLPLVAAPSS